MPANSQFPSKLVLVRAYLRELERALDGADTALVHDALVDAEVHLRQAIASGRDPEAAIRDFGSAQDIADAYLDMTTEVRHPSFKGSPRHSMAVSVSQPAAGRRRWRDVPVVGIWVDPNAWGSLVFLTFGFIFALAACLWLVGLGSVALFTLPLLVGIPLLVLLLGSARSLSLAQGKIIEWLVGIRMPRRANVVNLDGATGLLRRIWCWVKDVRSWLTTVFLLGNAPVALICCLVFSSLALCGVAGVGRAIFNPATKQALILGKEGGTLGWDTDSKDEPDSPAPKDEWRYQGHGVSVWAGEKKEPLEHELHLAVPAPDCITESTPDGLRLSLGGRVLSLVFGLLILTATLWLAKGTAWMYGQVVKAIQVVRVVRMDS